MLNNEGAEFKHAVKLTLDGTTGVKGDSDGYPCFAETQIRMQAIDVGGTNTVVAHGRLVNSSAWTSLGTLTGVTDTVIDVTTWDYVRYSVGVASGTGTFNASGFIMK